MLSKWKWIAKACTKHDFEKSTRVANEIETLLQRLYGNTNTEEWENDHENFVAETVAEIDFVRAHSEYCIACEESSDCGDCLLAINDFRCGNEKSLYRKFTRRFWKEGFKK